MPTILFYSPKLFAENLLGSSLFLLTAQPGAQAATRWGPQQASDLPRKGFEVTCRARFIILRPAPKGHLPDTSESATVYYRTHRTHMSWMDERIDRRRHRRLRSTLQAFLNGLGRPHGKSDPPIEAAVTWLPAWPG